MQKKTVTNYIKLSVFDQVLRVEMCNDITSDFKFGKYFLQIVMRFRSFHPCPPWHRPGQYLKLYCSM
jgi:hypothetical protein